MTREEYMAKLQKYLRKLPKQDYEDAIEYFNEYFSDTDEEGQQKLMEELGTPKEAAADLMCNLLDSRGFHSQYGALLRFLVQLRV